MRRFSGKKGLKQFHQTFMRLLQFFFDKLRFLPEPLILQSHYQLTYCEIWSQRLNVFLDLVYGLLTGFCLFVIKERMNQKIRFKSHYPKRPYVHCLCELFLLVKKQLRRPVNYSSGDFVCCLLQNRCPKICYLIYSFRIYDIFRLYVSVKYFLLMNEHQSSGHVHQHLKIFSLHKVFHLNPVPQRKLSQLYQKVNIFANNPTINQLSTSRRSSL
jgi:hypothetical protein